MQIIQEGDMYRFDFRYNQLIIAKIKEIPGRKYDYVNKVWRAPVKNKTAVEAFAKRFNGVFVDRETQEPEKVITVPDMPAGDIQPRLKRELFNYQRQGVQYALDKKRLIIGDTMGLGKTAQAIATISEAQAFPCLVICPSSLKINWQREWQMWTDHKAIILSDQIKSNFHLYWQTGMAKVFVVNFESLKKYFVESITIPKGEKLKLTHIKFREKINMFKSVIIDEAHRTKSGATQQSKFTMGICRNKEWVLALTGTPVINKPRDLISQLHIIGQLQPAFGGYSNFVKRYCNGDREASNLKELNAVLRTHCFYRRDKSEVLKDLPAKMRQVVICELDAKHRKEYNEAEADLVKYLKEYKEATDAQIRKSMRGEVMVRIGVLKNISARGKLGDVYDFIHDVMDSGEKLVVFGHLKEVIGNIKTEFPKALSITGEDDNLSRQSAVDRFQTKPEDKLIVCSTKAAGVGLTLTASSRVAFVELPWTYADCEQAEDRCHRIGAKDNVTCYYFLGRDTIDEKIYDIIQTKKDIARTVTGATEQIEVDVIEAIANLFTQEKEEK